MVGWSGTSCEQWSAWALCCGVRRAGKGFGPRDGAMLGGTWGDGGPGRGLVVAFRFRGDSKEGR